MTTQPAVPHSSTKPVSANPVEEVALRMLPLERLDREMDTLRQTFEAAKPFPHLTLDGFFDAEILDQVDAEFPEAGNRDWITWDNENEIKQTSRGLMDLGPMTQLLLLQLNSAPFLARIEEITGIKGLVWDPLFHGAGLHESHRGGWLNIHADWTGHPTLPMIRRLNLIIYLNKNWEKDWKGALTLQDPEGAHADVDVEPVFNRAVLFPTTEHTLHGFPDPLQCPANRSRRSISVYYWSADPDEVRKATYIRFLPGNGSTRTKALLRSFIPPALLRPKETLNRLRRKG